MIKKENAAKINIKLEKLKVVCDKINFLNVFKRNNEFE
jgi:hypothetical protein